MGSFLYRWASLTLVSLGLSLISACGSQLPEEADTGSSGNNPEVGVVTNSSFYVRVFDSGKYPYLENKSTGFVAQDPANLEQFNCSVPTGQNSNDVTCYIDVPEGDTFFHGMSLQYNVPQQMCVYLRFSNYFYYNHETGYGPSLVVIDKTVNADSEVTAQSCTADGQPCTPTNEISSVDYETNSVRCVYDKTILKDYPNCCFGSYTLRTIQRRDEDGDGSPDSTTTTDSERNWGGDFGKCLSGPAVVDSEWPKDSNGTPGSVIYYVENQGINDSYDIKGNLNVFKDYTNYQSANFYTPATQTHDGYVSTRTTTLPYAIDPVDDRSGDLLPTLQDSYEFECLDRGFDVVNRIRVYVREWNTLSQFLLYASSKGTQGDPDIEGEETSDCDYGTYANKCNDQLDWDDIVPVGGYDTSGGGILDRILYFPEEI